MSSNELVIEVAGADEGLRLASFLEIAGNTLDILGGLARSVDPRERVDWRVSSVVFGSPLQLTIRGEARHDPRVIGTIVEAYMEGIAGLETKEAIPELWRPEDALKAKAIAASRNRSDVGWIAYRANGNRAEPTQRLAAHVDAVLREAEDKGVFEGRLEVLSVHEGRSFNIYDDLTGRRVECRFKPDQLERAKQALDHRVSIYGTGRYDQAGQIKSVAVETIDLLPDAPQLADIGDAPPIDITGGVESSEYVRGLRDE